MAEVAAETRPTPARRESGVPAQAAARRRPRRLLRFVLLAVGAAVLVIGGLWYYLATGRYVTTADAYVQANVLTVSTDVSGIVAGIPVHEGERVTKGEVLFRLDPTRFRIALDNAAANLGQTEYMLRSLKADYLRARSQAAAAQATVQSDQSTYERYAALVHRGAVTEQQSDDAKYKLATDQATLAADEADANSVLARLGANADARVDRLPAYKQAAARLAEARRELDHATVLAPFGGVVTEVSKLQPGQFLPAGSAGFGLIQTGGMWIAAEPKETSLTHVRAGESARVTVDAYPGHVWHGTVQSVAVATDQEFSVLPAENASGNWVKVVQRVPVRIAIATGAHDPPLSAGMSAEVSIDTGHSRSLGALF